MTEIHLRKGAGKRLKSGHQWVFSNELAEIPKLEPGSLVDVIDAGEHNYGKAFYNPNSLITLRLLSTDKEPDTAFFTERIGKSLEYRKSLFPGETMFRLVFGESDFLPGLIIDKYGDYISLQLLSFGMDQRKDTIIEALLDVLPETKGIYEKGNSHLRKIEGLNLEDKIVFGNIPDEIEVEENGLKFSINLVEGQKTGYYLDQRDNRFFLRKITSGKKVLDCFCNQGGFALNAASGGATECLGIDSSESALLAFEKNIAANSFENISFKKTDVFDFLRASDSKWDVIVLDPPAFAKNKKSVTMARKGYTKLNVLAMEHLAEGGFLATSSCSQHIREDVFYDIVCKAAMKHGRKLRLVHRGIQSPDHPILPSMPETQYLKFFVFQVF